MKVTRIRYTTEDNVELTSKPMIAGTKVVTVIIDLSKLHYSIQDENHKCLVKELQGKSKTHIFKEVKNKLKELGVVFADEIRVRTPKVTVQITDKNLNGRTLNS